MADPVAGYRDMTPVYRDDLDFTSPIGFVRPMVRRKFSGPSAVETADLKSVVLSPLGLGLAGLIALLLMRERGII
ncbi:MAG: hypothetical protein QXT73_06910 [Candidatus Methanomethylicaceae archaeon]